MKFVTIAIISAFAVAPALAAKGSYCCYYSTVGCSADPEKRVYAADVGTSLQVRDLTCCCYATGDDACKGTCVSAEYISFLQLMLSPLLQY